MASLPIGSDELIFIQTEKVNLTIKGQSSHPNSQGAEYKDGQSTFRVSCREDYDISIKGDTIGKVILPAFSSDCYTVSPLFFEQQRYEVIVEAANSNEIEFWHDNLNIRKMVTPIGRNNHILTGIINFGNEIGLSDIVIKVDGKEYLRITLEVFPTKIDYREDYKAIINDVTAEVYNVVFDFLKKTYLNYRQGNRVNSSPVEFYAVIRQLFDEFVKAVDIIIAHPHHILETTHEVLPSHKVKAVDGKSLRWIEAHQNNIRNSHGQLLVSKALAVRKQVTYDTRENRLTKYILHTIKRKLEEFKSHYQNLLRNEDKALTEQIESMIQSLQRRCNAPVWSSVGMYDNAASMSLVFSMAPGYRELYKDYLMLLRGLSITGDVFHISVKDLAVLYEYWCFIKLNSLLKDRYELVSQDIIKVQGNGLYVSLVKGSRSRVKYRNPLNGETIMLSYNPKATELPTGTQRPDNVLSLEKKGAGIVYEYVFDAKYRMNPALPGTDYYNSISKKPGPEVDDINTMHRYRDSIVYQNGASPYERTMFGAYVLFPYGKEEEYRTHRFYESIGKVNIGGLPFLPSATSLVSALLDELIADSPESAFERTTLPRGIEEKLARVDWKTRDVLIGDFRSREQMQTCYEQNFYYVPATIVKESDLPIHYVALYQSAKLFGTNAGIRYYGVVKECALVKRRDITEIPRDSDEPYYRFSVQKWKTLTKPITVREHSVGRQFTNLFLLEHSTEAPELRIRSETEYRLFTELKRAFNHTEINDESSETGFLFNQSLVQFEDGKIHVYRNQRICDEYDISDFVRTPRAVLQHILNSCQ